MGRFGKGTLIVLLSLLLALATTSLAAAQTTEAAEACSGESVAGTVVSVDESTGEVTIAQGGGELCTVQLDTDYDHPITTLLGNYFNDADAETLLSALDTLSVNLDCPEGDSCSLADDGEGGTSANVVAVMEVSEGVYEVVVEYTDDEGNTQTEILTIEDPDLVQAWMVALDETSVEWQLNSGDDGTFVSDAGDEIAQLHEDGMGFGVIVKLYSMAEDAAEACSSTSGDPESESSSSCEVSLDGLIEAFQGGTGLGLLFQEYGKPSFLGVGHVRQATDGRNHGPPDNACGYWQKQGDLPADHPCYEDPAATTAGSDPSNGNGPPETACGYWNKHGGPEHPCNQEDPSQSQNNGRGKPPWAGGPGGPDRD